MKPLLSLLAGTCCLFVSPVAAEETPSAPGKPNIIVVLVDDMGWSDLGCYGSEIPTPNLDALAKNGLRFTQFYNTARCCPTRASLLTGLYPHQAGVGHMVAAHKDANGKVLEGYAGRLNDRCVTLAEVLGSAGYFTAMSGKWHVGQNQGVVPWERGFQRSLNAAAVVSSSMTARGPTCFSTASMWGAAAPTASRSNCIPPTCGPSYPKEFIGHAIQLMEGRSLVPAFANKPIQREAIFWEHEGNAAIRLGDWKLVRRSGQGAWELYDLKTDRTEQKNLAATHAQKGKELADAWEAWAKRARVVPGPARFSGDGTEAIPDGDATPKAPAKAGARRKGWKLTIDTTMLKPVLHRILKP